jgi:hypothetical protein
MTLTLIDTSNEDIVKEYRNTAYLYVNEFVDLYIGVDESDFNTLKDEYLTETKPSPTASTDDVFSYFCISMLSNTFVYIKKKIVEFNQKIYLFNKEETYTDSYTFDNGPGTDEQTVDQEKTRNIEIIEETINKIKPIGKKYICLSLGGPIGDYAIEKTNEFIKNATKSTSGGKRNHQKRKPTKKKRKFTKKQSSHQ